MSASTRHPGNEGTLEERSALLPTSRPSSPHNPSDSDRPGSPSSVDIMPPELRPGVKRKLTRWEMTWRVVFTGFILVSTVLIVKAVVDSDSPDFDLHKALKKALGGGLSGAAAMILQVLTLMPLRTIMNYQYRFGTSFKQARTTLYADGGYGRYYQGLGAALFQGPLSRFGDTAANAFILTLLNTHPVLSRIPSLLKTILASLCAAAFRMVLTPIDTLKTTLQAQGPKGWKILARRIKFYGVGTLWYGAFATAAATFAGHYPWFGTYNWLDANLPLPANIYQKLLRQAFMGFCASVISDSISNSLRVVKTYRQVNETRVSYNISSSQSSRSSPSSNSDRRLRRLPHQRSRDAYIDECASEHYVLYLVEVVHGSMGLQDEACWWCLIPFCE